MKTLSLNEAYAAAVAQLTKEPAASAVTVEFVMKTTGLVKYMRVHRSDVIEIFDTPEQVEG
jgi:hypothetical protein